MKNLLKAFIAVAVAAGPAKSFSTEMSKDESSYSMIVSLGLESDDKDVIISKNYQSTVSFKYCPAKDAKGNLTPVAAIRAERFIHPGIHSNQTERAENLDQKLASLYLLPSCHFIGSGLYGRVGPLAAHASSLWYVGSGIGAAFLLFGAYGTNIDLAQTRSKFATLSTTKLILSRKMSLIGPALILVSSGVALGTLGYGISESFNQSHFDEINQLEEQSDAKLSGIIISNESMKKNVSELESALHTAIERRLMVPL